MGQDRAQPSDRQATRSARSLAAFAGALFGAAGLEPGKARIVADLLVEADLMGHTTHGLALAPRYLEEMASGSMALAGEPDMIADTGPCVSWDGRRLPGVYLASRAVDLAVERAGRHGTATVAVGNSHHIGCLAVYLRSATDRGCLVVLASSDPSQANVAPLGGRTAVFSPNPVAAGIPTDGDPILIDVSSSATTNNMGARLLREGRRYDQPVLLDAEGTPTDDPAVLRAGGSILPAGGLEGGQKGYGWALLVEALTQGLAGFGRHDTPKGWGASFFVQVFDPAFFAGLAAFTRQSTFLAGACRASAPRPGVEAVRLPGERSLANRRAALERGLALHPGTFEALLPWAERLGVEAPRP